jgi:cytochrome c
MLIGAVPTAIRNIVRHGAMSRASLAFVLAAAALGPVGAADSERGKTLFQACAACHDDGANPLGPTLRGVFGRKSAAIADYRYSGPMMRANLVWDEANLKDYIADPQKKVRGNRMPFGGITNTGDVDDVIAFLKTYK